MIEPNEIPLNDQPKRGKKRAREVGSWEGVLLEYRGHVDKAMEACAQLGIPPNRLDQNGRTLLDVLRRRGLISIHRAAL